jgi:hypothetical protein
LAAEAQIQDRYIRQRVVTVSEQIALALGDPQALEAARQARAHAEERQALNVSWVEQLFEPQRLSKLLGSPDALTPWTPHGASAAHNWTPLPRSFLLAAGLEPERDFKRVAFSGAHDATIAAVAAGKVQAGALNVSVWEKFVAEKKVDTDKVRVFFTTPPYFDYNWTVSSSMPEALRNKVAQAFLALDKNTPEGKQILDLQRASRFVPTKAENYKAIEAAARSAGLL